MNPLYYAAAGGVILGIATSLNYCLRGKVTGMSGIVYNLSICNKSTLINIQHNYLKNCPLLEVCLSLLAFSSIFLDMAPTMDSHHSDHNFRSLTSHLMLAMP